MTPREIRRVREGRRFMPRLWEFAYPPSGRRFGRLRRAALRAWCAAFRVRVVLLDL